MNNRTLAYILGIVFLIYTTAVVAITLFYDGDQAAIILQLGGIAGLFVPALLGLRQSLTNGETQRLTAAKVDAVVEQTYTTAVIVEQAAVMAQETQAQVHAVAKTTETTHQAVNGQMDEFKLALKELAAMKVELAAALARERGIAIGREQVHIEAGPPAKPEPQL